IGGSNNLVGGISPGSRNVISANKADGIFLFNPFNGPPFTFNNRIEGNYIGTKPDGVSGGVGNRGWGERIGFLLAGDVVIGGVIARQGNVISGNGSTEGDGGGILIDSGARVQNNLIGVGADRTTHLGNLGEGISINSSDNLIGGSFTFFGLTFP